MNKRYQIFVSSTFRDLEEERQAVISLILSMDHIPAGMELFPSDDASSWEVIQRVIDFSDYYILIVGGKYGSTTSDGISYTEKEYNYAVAEEIPVLAFVHGEPDTIPQGKVELDPETRAKLDAFRQKVEKRHNRTTWTSAEDLKGKVAVAISQYITRNPKIGWMRTDAVEHTNELLRRIDEVQRKNESLSQENSDIRNKLSRLQEVNPEDLSGFAQGADTVELHYSYAVETKKDDETEVKEDSTDFTWDEVFLWIAPMLIGSRSDYEIRQRIMKSILSVVSKKITKLSNFGISNQTYETVRDQLMALKLIDVDAQDEDSERRYRGTTRVEYWFLTEYGKQKMLESTAIRRDAE